MDGYPKLIGRDGNNEYISCDSSNVFVADNKWHNIIGIVNRNILSLWVDGVKVSQINTEHKSVHVISNMPFEIARYYEKDGLDNSLYYTGYIDNVKIFSKALSESDILSLSIRH